MRRHELNEAAPALHDHRLGHRERLRVRLRAGGGLGVHDYELVELLLCLAVPRRDMKPVAERLHEAFSGDLSGLLAASRADLMRTEGVGEAAADVIALVGVLVARSGAQSLMKRDVLSSWSAVVAYCQRTMQGLGREQFRVLFLDRKNKLIRDETMGEGTVDQAPVYPREVVRRALELQASALILVHNHPSGDPAPSSADVEMTRLIVEAARTLEISVHDHLIVGREGHASLRQMGLM
jgi:DNA repair protein RadC